MLSQTPMKTFPVTFKKPIQSVGSAFLFEEASPDIACPGLQIRLALISEYQPVSATNTKALNEKCASTSGAHTYFIAPRYTELLIMSPKNSTLNSPKMY